MTKTHSDELKLKIVDEFEAGGITVAELSQKYGVEKNTIYTWTKKSTRPSIEAIRVAIRGQKTAEKFGAVAKPIARPSPQHPLAQALREYKPTRTVEQLERENALLKKLVKAYREMVGEDL